VLLPAVPDVEPVVLDPAPPAALDPAPPAVLELVLPDPVLPVDADEPAPDPMRALVSIHIPLRELEAVLPLLVVPLVPVAPDALLPPCRHPVTVIERALLEEPAV
jgi:hypothetical protein